MKKFYVSDLEWLIVESGTTLGTYSPYAKREVDVGRRHPAYRVREKDRFGRTDSYIVYADHFPEAVISVWGDFLAWKDEVFLCYRKRPLDSFIPDEATPL